MEEKKKITDLKQGDKIFYLDRLEIKWADYLCVHPKGMGKYHILIDHCENPFRVYEDRLKELLSQNLNSYEEARKARIVKLKEMLEKEETKVENKELVS